MQLRDNVVALPYNSWSHEYTVAINRIERKVQDLTAADKRYLGRVYDYLEARYEHSPEYHKEIFSVNYPDFPIEKFEYYLRTSRVGALWIHAFMLFEDENFFIRDAQPQ